MSDFPRRMLRLPAAALLTAAVSAAALVAAGCSTGGNDASARPVPTPSGHTAAVCRALHEHLPHAVNGLGPNGDRTGSDFAADWGDPAVQLRCGVPRPEVLRPGSEHYNPTADAVEVNGVTWLMQQQHDGFRFTTTGRAAFVEVTVPGKYAPELNVLTDLATAVRKTVPTTL